MKAASLVMIVIRAMLNTTEATIRLSLSLLVLLNLFQLLQTNLTIGILSPFLFPALVVMK